MLTRIYVFLRCRFCVASYLFPVQDWECQTVLFSDPFLGPCPVGVSAHVFNPSITGLDRYGFYLSLRFAEVVQILRRIIFVSRAGLGVPDRSFF